MFDAVRYLDCTPEIVGASLTDVEIVIAQHGDHYRIAEEGALIGEATTPKGVVEALHIHLFKRSLEERPMAALIHAACLRRGQQRLLIAGTKGAGKTTLALRLLRAGYRIEGDEHVFIDGSGVIARPRGVRVKAAGLAQLGDVTDIVAASPSYTFEGVGTVFNVDPRALGGVWQIEYGAVDGVIILHPNHGGKSSMAPLPAIAMVQSLMPEVGMRETGRGATIAALAALANRAPAFLLSVGDHTGALECVNSTMDAL